MELVNTVQSITINTSIDMNLLKIQKHILLQYAEQNHMLYGLIYLIDQIQDSVYDSILDIHGEQDAEKFANLFIYQDETLVQ
jgi:hypothetical protein